MMMRLNIFSKKFRGRAIAVCFGAAFLSLVLHGVDALSADDPKVIAVAADTNQASSLISRDPLTCAYYLLFAPTGELLESLENPYSGGPAGAAEGLAGFLARHEVEVVVAGNFPPAVISAMEAGGIRPVVFKGVAREGVLQIGPEAGK